MTDGMLTEHVQMDLLSTTNTRTLKLKSGQQWTNGGQKLVATTVSSREAGIRRRPRVVKRRKRHAKNMKTRTRVEQKGAVKVSSTPTETFHCAYAIKTKMLE